MGNIGTKTFTVTLGGTAKQFTANRIDYGKIVVYCFDSKGDVDFSGATLSARTSLAVSNLTGSGETPIYGSIKAFQAGQTNTYIAYQRLTVNGGFDSYLTTNNTTTTTVGFGFIVVATKN